MRTPRTKLVCALAAIGLGAGVLAGCGNDVPAGSVATVGDTNITKQDLDKWLATAAQGQAQGSDPVVPDPPDFEKCVAAKRKQPRAKGARKPSDATLKKQCQQQYDQLKREVMQFLIQAEWVQQEAKAQGVKVSDAEVRRSLEDQKNQVFPNEKAYKQYLKTSGMTEQDILFRVKVDTLQQKLSQKITQREAKVTDADVEAYYEKNKKRFAQPERRDLLVVLTKTRAKAEQAKRALERGQSWKAVARRYSIDEASKSQGGKLPDVARGQQERALDRAVFNARKGKVVGPVKTQFGWYVFKVTRVKPASQQSLEESKDTIRSLLRSERQQKAIDGFIKTFREDYKDKTTCADGYVVAECSNAPKAETDTGAVSGGTPGGSSGGASGGVQPTPEQPSQP
ncbi:MAG: peptidyl-prolyl cis-trans isomerase [Nocardioidaceae bacterium]